jgi:hypothetical protein
MGRFGGYNSKREADMRRINGEIKKIAKAVKRKEWLDRKIKRRLRPKGNKRI